MKKKILILFVLGGAFACKNKKGVFTESKFTEVRFEKKACFGTCPVYQYTINSQGLITYEGKRFVERQGIYTKSLSSSELKELSKKIEKLNVFSFENEYPSPYSDLPVTEFYYKQGSKEKSITVQGKCPESLTAFFKELEEITKTGEWVKKSRKGNP